MNLGLGLSSGHAGAEWIDATEFAEVVYRSREVLVVSVATDLAEDQRLADALIDVIASSERCEAAETAITTLAGALDLDVHSGRVRAHAHGERHLTIAPRPPLEAAAEAAAEPLSGSLA